MEDVNDLRVTSDLKQLYPPTLAKALDALVTRIIAEHSEVVSLVKTQSGAVPASG